MGGRHSRLAVVFPIVYTIHISHGCIQIQTRSDYTTDISVHPLHVGGHWSRSIHEDTAPFPIQSSSRSWCTTTHKRFWAKFTATKSAQVATQTRGLTQSHTIQLKDKHTWTILINHLVRSVLFLSAEHSASEKFASSNLIVRREQTYSLGQEFLGKRTPNECH